MVEKNSAAAAAPMTRARVADRARADWADAPFGRIRWTKKRKAAFLDRLAATCNVADSSRVAGVSVGSAYGLRRRDRAFAADWTQALQAGYEVLELRLVAHALAGGGAIMVGADADGEPPVDVMLGLKLLAAHRATLLGKPSGRGRPPNVATREEATAAILQRLNVVAAQYRKAPVPAPELLAAPENSVTSTGPE